MPVSTSIITPSSEPAAPAAADSDSGVGGLVDGDEHVTVTGQLGQDADLLAVGNGVHDKEVVETGPGEGDGLPDRGHRQPDRSRGYLPGGELGTLVDLDVGPDLCRHGQ